MPALKRRRKLIIILLLITGLVGGYVLQRGPQLHPITARSIPAVSYPYCPLVFSAHGLGYPAAETNADGYLLHDDRCQSLPGKRICPNSFNLTVSPTRKLLGWLKEGRTHKGTWFSDFYVRAHDSKLHRFANPNKDIVINGGIYLPTDRYPGIYLASDGYEPWPFTSEGRRILLPGAPKGFSLTVAMASGDPRYLPLTDRKTLGVYDTVEKRLVMRQPAVTGGKAMVFSHQARLLFVHTTGQARIYERGKLLASIKTTPLGWRWGEDGTVWTLDGGRLRVLHWRDGTPGARLLRTSGTPDASYGSLAYRECCMPPFRDNSDPDWAAAWGDGRLTASVERLRPPPAQFADVLERGCKVLHLTVAIPRGQCRLTLYRNGRRVGSYTVAADNVPPPAPPLPMRGGILYKGPPRPPRTPYHQHLAFTADGKYLSWAIDGGHGLKLYVFKID